MTVKTDPEVAAATGIAAGLQLRMLPGRDRR